MKLNRKWLIPLVATFAAGTVMLQNSLTTRPAESNLTTADTPPAATSVSASTQAYEGCAYVWAYRDAPQLDETFSAVVQAIEPAATARAQFFGEDCIYADGRSEFHAKETDFYVRLPVEDLTDKAALGDLIKQVMQAVSSLPRGEPGGNYGYVEFSFQTSAGEQTVMRVPIQTYTEQGQRLDGVGVYDLFNQASP